MVQHSGSSQSGDFFFDLQSTSAVSQLLKLLRIQTTVSATERNEIRDMIFAYRTTGGSEAERQTIVSRLLVVGVTEEFAESVSQKSATDTPTQPQPIKAGFAHGRLAPQFHGVPITSKSTEPKKVVPDVAQKSIATPSAQLTTKQFTTPQHATRNYQRDSVAMTPRTELPVAKPKLVVPPVPVKTIDATAQPEKTIQQSTPSISVVPVDTMVGQDRSAPDTASQLERIRVIKADINARAGNPVNVVSINSEVGREYMSALLDAMKQLGSGSPETMTTAMQRLEIAYEQALTVLQSAAPRPTTATEQNLPRATTPATPTVAIPVVPTVVPTVPARPVVPNVPAPQTPDSVVNSLVKNVPPEINPPLGATRQQVAAVLPTTTGVSVAQPAVPPVPATSLRPLTPPTPPRPYTDVPDTDSEAVQIHSSKLPPLAPVSTAAPLRKVEELPTLAEVRNRSESGNPLYTQEISDGLEQLLSEWAIFKKSGILGTGPHGTQHPLFKKIGPLQIPLILAGRFEGATEAVRQSITDYMNGWRYEQGIVYDKDETFEVYLRRVIRHIIDLQKK